MPNLWLIFTTGLLAGGLTCLAVQGGLLAAILLARPGIKTVMWFLAAKLMAYTILGFVLGLVGSAFQINSSFMVALQFGVVIFMIGSALNMLNVHPIFRYFALQPPRFLSRIVRDQATPFLLGAFTVFIPCGTTQVMMFQAVGTGNPVYGAAVMAAFVLGTIPLFFALGFGMSKLEEGWKAKMNKIAATVIIVLALFNLNSTMALATNGYTFGKLAKNIVCTIAFCGEGQKLAVTNPTDVVTIKFESNGYTVDNPVIKAGEPVTVNLVNESGYGCIQAFRIPALGISKIVKVGDTQTLTITAPKTGQLAFMCSMGMFRGTLTVI